MIDVKTKEMPLVSARDMETAQFPQVAVAADDQTRKIAPEQVPATPPAPNLPSPFSTATGELPVVQAAPRPAQFPAPPVAAPPPFNPAVAQPAPPAAQAPAVAAPVARRPRRWPFNYVIDPEMNKIKKARFSLSAITGLLSKYNIEIDMRS